MREHFLKKTEQQNNPHIVDVDGMDCIEWREIISVQQQKVQKNL